MNLLALEDLPEFSSGPRGRRMEDRLRAIHAAGYDGVQFVAPAEQADLALSASLGLGRAGSGRINRPDEAGPFAARMAAEGQECATVHVGWGLEDDDEACRLIEAVLEASANHGVPIYFETHRATILQDIWRTVQFVRRFPEMRFNGDFSHWYTGLEMVYGGFETKLRFIEPVLDRVRFVHGRIGNPGSMQVDIGDGDPQGRPFVAHFRALWKAAFMGFLRAAAAGDYICFVPELLSPRIYYARAFPRDGGEPREESDRWEQSKVLRRIASECFAADRDAPPELAGFG